MTATATSTNSHIWKIINGSLLFFLHPGQIRALESVAQVVAIIAGTQSGKTVFGPVWLLHEMMKRGPGEYGVVSPTFKLMKLKALKEFLKLFEKGLKLGKYNKGDQEFIFSEDGLMYLFGRTDIPCSVQFGHASNPDSLESMTLLAVWCDEAGQKAFKGDSYEALQRRLNFQDGRMLITTTPYDLGWLKRMIWDKWMAGDKDIEVISFKTIDNPSFPKDRYYAAKKRMPRWKFLLFYDAIFTKPAGTIYDCFNEDFHVVPAFSIPKDWIRPWGVDFGSVNTACCKVVVNPDYDEDAEKTPWNRKYYLYQTYKAGGKTEKRHIESLLAKDRPGIDPKAVGGAPSEDEWRDNFGKAGLYIKRPTIVSVEVGIASVYAMLATGELAIFDTCTRLIDDLNSYSRELDKNDEPTKVIAEKHSYHRLDALRYVCSEIEANPGFAGDTTVIDTYENQNETDHDI